MLDTFFIRRAVSDKRGSVVEHSYIVEVAKCLLFSRLSYFDTLLWYLVDEKQLLVKLVNLKLRGQLPNIEQLAAKGSMLVV